MCLFFQKHGFVICKKIIVYLLKFKSKQSFANLLKLGVSTKVCITFIKLVLIVKDDSENMKRQ